MLLHHSIMSCEGSNIVFPYRKLIVVLHCGDLPSTINVSESLPPTPWLIGAKVNFTCRENYMLKDEDDAIYECELDEGQVVAQWYSKRGSSHGCIPGMFVMDTIYNH